MTWFVAAAVEMTWISRDDAAKEFLHKFFEVLPSGERLW
jgi:hypothetical protein